jgi:hypothetical protein
MNNSATEQEPKKWRICQNFAQLNKVTEVVSMPQGDILSKQQWLSGQRYISIFDFAAGYYAIEVPEKWHPYLAFYIKGRGYFWYQRMPMGITGALTAFCDTVFLDSRSIDGTPTKPIYLHGQ